MRVLLWVLCVAGAAGDGSSQAIRASVRPKHEHLGKAREVEKGSCCFPLRVTDRPIDGAAAWPPGGARDGRAANTSALTGTSFVSRHVITQLLVSCYHIDMIMPPPPPPPAHSLRFPSVVPRDGDSPPSPTPIYYTAGFRGLQPRVWCVSPRCWNSKCHTCTCQFANRD